MLQSIRDNLQGTLAKVVIAIIIVPFAIFGVESLFSIGGNNAPATVNGEDIDAVALERAIAVEKRNLLSRMGDDIRPELLEDSRLRSRTLDALITQTILTQYADKVGLGVPDALLDQIIVSTPAFQENGRFSADRYRLLLANQGYTPGYFKNEVLRDEILIGQLQRAVMGSDFTTPAELARVAALAGQQRSFSWLVIPPEQVAADEGVSDAEVEAWYQANQDRFMQEARVRLAYTQLRADDFEVEVSEADIRAEYEHELSQAAGTRREAAHILITTDERSEEEARQLAEQLRQQLEEGAVFSELAAEFSEDIGSASNGGELGATEGDTFPAEFENALAGLEVGQVSEPVRTDAGWHLIRLLSEDEAEKPSFEERRDEIAARLAAQRAQPQLIARVERLRDLAFNSATIREPAEQLGLEVEESDWLTRNNDHPLLGRPAVMAAAFSSDVLEQGHNSDVLELAPDHYLLLRVIDQKPAEPLPLTEVKDLIANELAADKARQAARQEAEQIAAAVAAGKASLAEVGDSRAFPHGSLGPVDRSAEEPVPGLLGAAFSVARPEGDTRVEVVSLPDGRPAVIALNQVAEGKVDALGTEEQQAWRAQLSAGAGNAAFGGLLESLLKAAEVKRR
ncbi:MAG: SurA N-terminal domain-containing protein [Spongiibacteraceae bacterium]|jgi:peptidyl-prolyl cis-trans isomerase D|nr:SurA N-terminal domain-containing protein [Spongiibacteraceae bacterium]